MGTRRKEARGEEREELAAVLMSEKVVGAVAEAIDVAGVEGGRGVEKAQKIETLSIKGRNGKWVLV